MLYYGLFWMRSPYLDLRWISRSTGTIPDLLIISIVRHKNKNRWVGDPLWRSCSLFCVVIFHSSFGLVKYPYTKQFTRSPQGIPPSPVLVIGFLYVTATAFIIATAATPKKHYVKKTKRGLKSSIMILTGTFLFCRHTLVGNIIF